MDLFFVAFSGVVGVAFAKFGLLLGDWISVTSVPLIVMILSAYGCGAILRRVIRFKWKPAFFHSLHHASEFFMNLFFATLGCTATLQEMQRVGPGALGMMSLVLAIHLTTMFG
eukprot:EG_transcript_61492